MFKVSVSIKYSFYLKVSFILFWILFFSDANATEVPVGLQPKIQNYEAKVKANPSNFEYNCLLIEALIANSNYIAAEQCISKTSLKKNWTEKQKMELLLLSAEIKKFQNDMSGALLMLLKCKKYFQKVKDESLSIKTDALLIEFYRKNVKFQKAIEIINQLDTVVIYNSKDLKNVNLLLNRIAAVYNEYSNAELSIYYSNRAIELAKKLQDTNALCISYNELGFSYKNLNQPKLSFTYYTLAFELWEKNGYYREALNAEFNCIRMKMHNQWITLDQQLPILTAFSKKCEKKKMLDLRYLTQEFIETYYVQKSDWKNAYTAQKLTRQLAIELRNQENSKEIEKVEEGYKNNELKNQIAEKDKEKKRLERQRIKDKKILIAVIILVLISFSLLIISFRATLNNRKSLKEIRVKDQQKSMLISEIHHRVKNNLQYVKSLLEMQLSIITETGDKRNLEDVSRRIQAMTLVHEMLYLETEKTGISIANYLKNLLDNLNVGYASDTPITINATIWEGDISISEATSIGIICAELFNNSVKYAFQTNDEPFFSLSFEKVNDQFELTVNDNGKQEGYDIKDTDASRYKLGMRIIDIFARQLKGTYTITNNAGFSFHMKYQQIAN